MAETEYQMWFNGLPDAIKEIARKYPASQLYYITETAQLCEILVYNEPINPGDPVTLKVRITRGYNLGNIVFDLNPKSLQVYHGDLN